ncbi:MAG: phosphoribosyl-AMP cyclohydrolase [Hyphomicrobiaceae bacterium]
MSTPDKHALEEGVEFQPVFNSDGLIPAIASDHRSGEVLMFAWMNAQALSETVATGVAHFWSRSRGKLWRKGETSGNTLQVVEMRTDCDQDVLWLRVDIQGDGKACHTGRRTCFYRVVTRDDDGGVKLRTD